MRGKVFSVLEKNASGNRYWVYEVRRSDGSVRISGIRISWVEAMDSVNGWMRRDVVPGSGGIGYEYESNE